jgi:hypothetical protein
MSKFNQIVVNIVVTFTLYFVVGVFYIPYKIITFLIRSKKDDNN